jgi:hypothetical protein
MRNSWTDINHEFLEQRCETVVEYFEIRCRRSVEPVPCQTTQTNASICKRNRPGDCILHKMVPGRFPREILSRSDVVKSTGVKHSIIAAHLNTYCGNDCSLSHIETYRTCVLLKFHYLNTFLIFKNIRGAQTASVV